MTYYLGRIAKISYPIFGIDVVYKCDGGVYSADSFALNPPVRFPGSSMGLRFRDRARAISASHSAERRRRCGLAGLRTAWYQATVQQVSEAFDQPFLVLAVFLLLFWFSARVGASFQRLRPKPRDGREDFTFITGATLTLLGLIIAFCFSMAVNRYQQRKIYEKQEASAIGTEYLRADLLGTTDGAKVRALLKSYLGLRVLSYESRNIQQLQQIDAETTRLQFLCTHPDDPARPCCRQLHLGAERCGLLAPGGESRTSLEFPALRWLRLPWSPFVPDLQYDLGRHDLCDTHGQFCGRYSGERYRP